MTEPVLRAQGLYLRTKRDWVFQAIDLTVTEGQTIALAGPGGSGRSMLLLTLAGRAKPSGGSLEVAGTRQRGKIRQVTSVARITGAVELDPDPRVTDHVHEASLLGRTELDYPKAARLVGLTGDGTTFVGDLAVDDAALFAVALAVTARPRLLVVDDVDTGATMAEQHRVWSALLCVAASGVAVVASTVDADIAASHSARVVTLAVAVDEETEEDEPADAEVAEEEPTDASD